MRQVRQGVNRMYRMGRMVCPSHSYSWIEFRTGSSLTPVEGEGTLWLGAADVGLGLDRMGRMGRVCG